MTLNGGMSMPSWYDIVGLDEKSSEKVDGIEASVEVVRGIVQEELLIGVAPSRIVLAGFSQGGALSLFTGLQLPSDQKPAAIVVMSGYLAGAGRVNITEGFEDIPILHCHGTGDMVVRYDWAAKSKDHLEKKGVLSYTLKTFEGMPHTANEGVVQAVLEFLREQIPIDENFVIKPKTPAEMSVKELKVAVRNAGLAAQAVVFSEKREFVELLERHYAENSTVFNI